MKKNYILTLLLVACFFFKASAQCSPPTNLIVTNITGTSAVLGWTSPGGPTNWEVIVQPFGSPAPVVNAPGMIAISSPYVITGLVPCTTYEFYVKAVCGPGDFSTWSGPSTFTTFSGLSCQASLTSVNPNTVTINATGGSAPYSFSFNGGPFQASGVFTNLTPGTYNFLVRDANGCTCNSTITIQSNSFTVSIGATLDIPTSTLYANVVGGVAPYTYQWQLNGTSIAGANSATLVINGVGGVYTVTVTDINGLTATAQTVVQGLPQPSANDDTIPLYGSGTNIVVSGESVLSNDFYNGLPVNTNPNSSQGVVLTPLSVPSGFSLNADGTISMLPGMASGLYTLTYKICLVNNANSCDTGSVAINVSNTGILMKAFIDTNGNNIQDSGEQNFTLGQFHYEKNNNGVVYNVYSNGNYFINEANVATYDLSYSIDSSYSNQYALTTSSYADINYDPILGVVIYNFPITALPYNDLWVSLSPYGASPRPGFTYINQIMYHNNGNQAIAAGSVTFTNNNSVTITAISQSGTTPTTNGFTYNFTNLAPYETRYIYVTMQVPALPTVALGQLLTNTVSVSIPSGDINVNNNSSALSQSIVGSYDPNDKTESHGGKIVYATFTSNDYLNYTIQFENTGTFYAENVRVNDILDAKLDETSVKMVAASHANTLNRVGNNLNWNFNGIDLQPGEKGYVTFEVKPKPGYVIGDIIPNTANIYFDFNPAIVTNTFQTEFVTALNTPRFENGEFRVYPNPTNNIVTISLNENDTIESVAVINVLGEIMQTKTFNNAKATLDLSALTDGMYFLKVKANGLEKVMKIMKQ